MLCAALLRVARRSTWHHRALCLAHHGGPSAAFRRNFADAGAKPPLEESASRKEDIDLNMWKSIASKSMTREASTDKPRPLQAPLAAAAGAAVRAEAPHEAASGGPAQQATDDAGGRADTGGARSEPAELDNAETVQHMIALLHEAGKSVPSALTEEQMQEYLEMPSKSMRQRFLRFLHKRECRKMASKRKQEEKREERNLLEPKEARPKAPLRNNFLLTFWNSSEERAMDWRLAQAVRFGQPLVIDMSYDDMMNTRASRSCAEQIIELISHNRHSPDPFHLYLCGYAPDRGANRRTACATLVRLYGADTLRKTLITDTQRSYLELFPRERIVYLTADSPNVLHEFDHSTVYVVGGFVDLSVESGVSLGHAKRHGLATARLPLERYLKWGLGGKNLTLDQMVKILDRIKDTGDWSDALRFVPRRKLNNVHREDSGSSQYGQRGQYGQRDQYGQQGQHGQQGQYSHRGQYGQQGQYSHRGQYGQQGQHGQQTQHAQYGRPFDRHRWGEDRPHEGRCARGREANGQSAGDAWQGGSGYSGVAAKGET